MTRWIALALLVAGCSRGNQDPCAGLGCATFEGSLTLRVRSGASGEAIAMPRFAEAGKALTASCDAPLLDGSTPDGGAAPCGAWVFYWSGHHVVEVSAPGFVTASVTVDIS